MAGSLPCWIYKSPRKDEMCLYLAAEEGFDQVPEVLNLQNDNGKAKPLENETGVAVASVFLIRS